MLKYRLFFLMLAGALLFASCSSADKPPLGAEVADEWTDLDNFHMSMAEMFHPFKDSANLAPIKQNAEQFAAEAEKWAAAALPEKVDNDNVKALMQQLKNDTRTLADKIKAGATDEELGKALDDVHTLFHKIEEAWHSGGHDHPHDH